jgi:hypothetical protein
LKSKYQVKTVEQLQKEGALSCFEVNSWPQEFKTAVVFTFDTLYALKRFCVELDAEKRGVFKTLRGHVGLPTLKRGFAEYLGAALIPGQRVAMWLFINEDDYKNILKPILDN